MLSFAKFKFRLETHGWRQPYCVSTCLQCPRMWICSPWHHTSYRYQEISDNRLSYHWMLLNPTHCSFKYFKPSKQARAGQPAGEVWVGSTHVLHHHRNNDSTLQSALKVIITLQDHLPCKPQCFKRGTCIKMEHIPKGSEQNKRPIFHTICTTKFGYWVTFLQYEGMWSATHRGQSHVPVRC